MIKDSISMDLPEPWNGESFSIDEVGPINYLVGPNGSGKSRFSVAMSRQLEAQGLSTRLLGTDRLKHLANPGYLETHVIGDTLARGYAKNWRNEGVEVSAVDTILMLEERLDLRIRVEATLSHLFNRDIELEWDAGNLVPQSVRRETNQRYRLDRDECHGIKELLVLLTHLYDHHRNYLIIDEPELNLHPQYQAFFMQEVRKVAGNPLEDGQKKVVFLITHSPFVLDLRNVDDLRSVISFDLSYSVPKQVAQTDRDLANTLITSGRLNAHHKQLFFADNPIFVEGHHDATMIEALMEARGYSAAAAGSCVIDCGGSGEVNHYLTLCQKLGKEAHFVYDLDSVFMGQLRQSVAEDDQLQGLLAVAGVGPNFLKYVGELERLLTDVIDTLVQKNIASELEELYEIFTPLGESDRKKWNNEQLSKARVAVMTLISTQWETISSYLDQVLLENIKGRWATLLGFLTEKNIHVLHGGPIERYLPSFAGNLLAPTADSKRTAVGCELSELQRIRELANLSIEETLAGRYTYLFEVVKKLPSKSDVDLENTLRKYISDFIHEIQKVVETNPDWTDAQIRERMKEHPLVNANVISLDAIRRKDTDFEAKLAITGILAEDRWTLEIDSNTTISNMGTIVPSDPDTS